MYEYKRGCFGINSGKSGVVVWKKLPSGIPEGNFFQTTTKDFPLFFRVLD